MLGDQARSDIPTASLCHQCLTACCSRAIARACGERGFACEPGRAALTKEEEEGRRENCPGQPVSLWPPLPPQNTWTRVSLRMSPKVTGNRVSPPGSILADGLQHPPNGRQRECRHVPATAPLHLQMGTETSPSHGSQHQLLPQRRFNNLLCILYTQCILYTPHYYCKGVVPGGSVYGWTYFSMHITCMVIRCILHLLYYC